MLGVNIGFQLTLRLNVAHSSTSNHKVSHWLLDDVVWEDK